MSPIASAIRSARRAVGSINGKSMPAISRAMYRRELVSWSLLAVTMGAVEGNVVGVIAKNAYAGVVEPSLINFFVVVLSGVQSVSNLSSILWAALGHARHKVRFIYGLMIATAFLAATMALAPRNFMGLVMLVSCVIGIRVCWTGVQTLRATIWRANYRREVRATITGKLATIQSLMLSAAALVIAQTMTLDARAFHVVYPIVAVVGLVGAATYRHLRVRRHRQLLSAEAGASRHDRPTLDPRSMIRVLRGNREFDRFMACQWVFGMGNLMVAGPLIIMLRDRFGMEYAGIHITSTVPYLLMPVSVTLWARLMNRVHIVKFRSIHSWAFVTFTTCVFLATLTGQMWLLWFGAAVEGIAFGGGVLAWNLGHHDFARQEQSTAYMSVHVFLTGFRGLLAMLLAWSLYEFFEWTGAGNGMWVFAVSAVLSATGAMGFVLMTRDMKRREREGSPATYLVER